MIAFRVEVNSQNQKFKVRRVQIGMGAADDPQNGIFFIRTPDDTDKLPPGVLIGAFNKTHSHNPVKKFSNLNEARDEGYEALRIMASSQEGNQEAPVAEAAEKPKRQRTKKQEGEGGEEKPKGPRLTQTTPKPLGEQKAAREGTKIAMMIDLLHRGIYADDLKTQLERKGRALSGRIHRVHGYGVHSVLKEGRVFYTLVLPDGMDKPLDHVKPEENSARTEGEGNTAEGEAKPKRTRRKKGEEEAATAEASAPASGEAASGDSGTTVAEA